MSASIQQDVVWFYISNIIVSKWSILTTRAETGYLWMNSSLWTASMAMMISAM